MTNVIKYFAAVSRYIQSISDVRREGILSARFTDRWSRSAVEKFWSRDNIFVALRFRKYWSRVLFFRRCDDDDEDGGGGGVKKMRMMTTTTTSTKYIFTLQKNKHLANDGYLIIIIYIDNEENWFLPWSP